MIELNDNGGWCWYQDERVIVDSAKGTMLVGSLATSEGIGGRTRGGDVEVVTYTFATGEIERVTLDKMREDDHAAPALLLRPDGRYLAMYTNHNEDRLSRYRISKSEHDATDWEPTQLFDWSTVKSNFNTTYSNLVYLSAEDRVYDFARADGKSPNVLVSDDHGSTWTYDGRLTTSMNVGYVNGYFKYASLGVDRIDFIGTEHHPRDYNNGIYHGYLQGGVLHLSDGTSLSDARPPHPGDLTPVFAASSVWGGETMTHAWPTDVQVDAFGRPYAIFSCRANDIPENSSFADHRFFYARWDGESWNVHQLAKAGPLLFKTEQDYTGLAALVPDDPNLVYISTTIDPRDGIQTLKHEIYEGVTADGGATWTWTAVTSGSDVDNIRPVVPIGDPVHRPLLWLRGTMPNFVDYKLHVVMRLMR